MFLGVFIINTIDLGCLEQHICFDFAGAKGGTGVGGEEWVAGTSSEDDNAFFFKVMYGFATDKGFANTVNGDGRHHATGLAKLFHGFLEGNSVEHGRQHAHVVGSGAGDVAVLGKCCTTNEITATHDNRELDTHFGNIDTLPGDGFEFRPFNAKASFFTKPFAADF